MSIGWHRIAPLLLVTLLFAACGGEEPFVSNGADDVTAPGEDSDASRTLDGAWVLTAGAVNGVPLELDDQWRVTMTIDGSEISGRAACNSYGGAVSIDDGVFSVGEIGQTEMACEPAVMDIESAFLQGLVNVTAATRSGDVASLTGEGVEYTFNLLPAVPTGELLGTRWVLDTIIQADTATSTVASADPAVLLLNTDGTFSGSTGCREIFGDYVVSGDTVQFTSFTAEGECPSELQWQDGQVITVLGDGFTANIDGDRLTLTASGGEGLSYKSEQ